MDFKFTPEIVRDILRKSEGALAPARVKGHYSFGHTEKRHSGSTNADLAKRTEETANGGISLYLAFIDFKQAVEIGTKFLNHSSIRPQIEKFYYNGMEGNPFAMGEEHRNNNGKIVRVVEDGGRLPLGDFDIGEAFNVRMAGHKGTLPTSFFSMRLQKKVGFPVSLMIVTFFPSLPL